MRAIVYLKTFTGLGPKGQPLASGAFYRLLRNLANGFNLDKDPLFEKVILKKSQQTTTKACKELKCDLT